SHVRRTSRTMRIASPGAGPGRVFYGGTVVTAAGLVLFMAYGTQYAFASSLVFGFSYGAASTLFPSHRRRRLRAGAGGHPRGPPLRPRRLDGRARSPDRRLHLRPR